MDNLVERLNFGSNYQFIQEICTSKEVFIMERLEQWKQRLLEAHNSTPFAEKKIVFGEGAAAHVLMMIG